MKEFRFLVFVIILIEVGIFACGLRIVYNRHTYRTMFIQLEREQQTYHSLIDELNRAKVELASLEQPSNIVSSAKFQGLAPVNNNEVVIIHLTPSLKNPSSGGAGGVKPTKGAAAP